MKRLLLTIVLCSIAFISYAQKPETYEKLKAYPKGVTIIEITTSDSTEAAYNKMAMLVMDYGFNLENSDRSLLYFNTKPTSLGRHAYKAKLNVRVKKVDNATMIIIKGDALSGNFVFPSSNDHRKDVPSSSFAHMFEIAEQYEGGAITVRKE